MIKITPSEFQVFASLIHALTGIVLDDSKAYLIEARLRNLLAECGYASFIELYFKAKSDVSRTICNKIIDAITTKETCFFRDGKPFELLQAKILPELMQKRLLQSSNPTLGPLAIWSAACSTGQETYSIAMVIRELLPDWRKCNLKIIGTDISDEALARARQGTYTKLEVERGLSPQRLVKFFRKIDANTWEVNAELQALVAFQKQNLLEPLAGLGKFDIIFCRNVAIYFDREVKTKLIDRLTENLKPEGYLFLGSTESLWNHGQFEPQHSGNSVCYQLKKSR